MGHPNEDLLRGLYEAFAKEDVGAMMQAFSPEVVWHESGNNPLSGDYTT